MTTVEKTPTQKLADVQARVARDDRIMRRVLALLLVLAGFTVGLMVGEQDAATAEVEFADAVTEQYPELERIDALMYGWMVCDAAADGWTPGRTAAWLDGEPREFFAVADPGFGRFVVDAALPMCP